MGAKITLTGTRISKITTEGESFYFAMNEGGTSVPPKGLPQTQKVKFKVYIGKKKANKLKLLELPKETKFMIQGEICGFTPIVAQGNFPVNVVPLEMAVDVVAFDVQLIEPKENDKNDKEPSATKQATSVEQPIEPKQPFAEKQTDAKPQKPSQDEGIQTVPLDSIVVPPEFLKIAPNPAKTQPVIDYATKHGRLDKPVTVKRMGSGKLHLVDGYRRYYVAKQIGFENIEIQFEKEQTPTA